MSSLQDTAVVHPMTDVHSAQLDFEDTFRAMMPELFNYLCRRTQLSEDAADCLSETLEVLWRKRSHLPADPEGRRKWAFGVAHKVAQSQARRAYRGSLLNDVLRERFVDSTPAADNDVHDLLKTLSNQDRELVELVVLDDFSIAQAGKILGLRAGAARMRYGRARAQLRITLDGSV